MISASLPTSIAKVSFEPSCCASGTTRSAMRSTNENASAAPSRCIAWAMPHAIERSVASPTIKARLPVRKPMIYSSLSALAAMWFDVHDQMLSGADLVALVESVPAVQLRDGNLKLVGDAVDRVALAHGVEHAVPI